MSAYQDILEWSRSRPMWQRDALRRLALSHQLSDSDYVKLLELCFNELESLELDSEPLEEHHIPVPPTDDDAVTISSIKHHCGVNALASDQSISFPSDGMTVIYGPNGSGKSGYARVFRRLCRSQETKTEILPNAFSSAPQPLKVDIHYRASGVDEHLQWNGNNGCPQLRQVGYFDGECGEKYFGRTVELTYKPSGIELLECLAEVCLELEGRINRELSKLQSTESALTIFDSRSKTGARIAALTAQTDLAQLKQSVQLSEEERLEYENQEKNLRIVEARLNRERLAQLGTREEKLSVLLSILRKLEAAHSDERLGRLNTLVEEHKAKTKAAELAAADAFQDSEMIGIGENAWRALWEAAREFSRTSVYPEEDFPNTSEGARCILCWQSVSPRVAQRFTSFEAFVQNSTAVALDQSLAQLQRIKSWYVDCYSQLKRQIESASVREYDEELAEFLNESLANFSHARDTLIEAFNEMRPPGLVPLVTCSAQVEGRLDLVRTELRELRELSSSPRLAQAKTSVYEFHQRRLASEHWTLVESHHSSLRRMSLLRRAKAQMNSSAVTRTASSITEKLVSIEIAETFADYVTKLSGRRLPVRCQPAGGQRGKVFQSVELENASAGSRVREVVSDGERRCAALATFLTEARFQARRSSLILDDPVSSLDHQSRENIAHVLVAESTERQVVLFTHDIVFVLALWERAKARGADIMFRSLERMGETPGHAFEDLPFQNQPCKKRIGELKLEIQNIKSRRAALGDSDYRDRAQRVASRLRACWERAVEEVALNGVVTRFGRSVQTMRLNKVAAHFNSQDYEVLEAEMTKLSCWIDGHDSSAALDAPCPEPQLLEQAVGVLEAWIKSLNARYK